MKRFWKGTAVFAAVMLAAAGLSWGILQLTTPKGGLPVFVGTGDYLRLITQDSIFLRALFNTLWMPALLALVLTAGFVVLKRLVLSRWRSRLREPVCYAGLTLALFLLQAAWLPWLLGWPNYLAVDVLHAPPPFILSLVEFFCSPISILLETVALELSLLLALLAWLADCLLSAGRKKRQGYAQADENAMPGDRT